MKQMCIKKINNKSPKKNIFSKPHEKGVGLIIIILIVGFMLTVGLSLVTMTGTGPDVASNVRGHQKAFNAAEAGFDATWVILEDSFATGAWGSFAGQYLKDPAGIDDPLSTEYFRRKTDDEILNLIDPDGDGNPDLGPVLFYKEPYAFKSDGSVDPLYTYTVFLIDDEAGGGDPTNDNDAILVCIGSAGIGKNRTTNRLEIELAMQLPGG